MLLDLVFRNPHRKEVLQDILHGWVVEVNAAVVGWPSGGLRAARVDFHAPRRNNTLCWGPLRRIARMPAEEPPQPTPATSAPISNTLKWLLPIPSASPDHDRAVSKRPRLSPLVRILLPLLHLLPHLPRLLFICKTQPIQRPLTLERMEKGPVLVVSERVIDLLVPEHAAVGGRDIDELEPEGVADEVIGEDDGALEAGVGPAVVGGRAAVELGDGDGVDLVAGFGDGPFDGLLVVVGEN